MRYHILNMVCSILLLGGSTGSAGDFPYREQYPEVVILESSELKAAYHSGNFVFVDVRSKAEFDAIHIKGAINIPYATARFTKQLGVVAGENPGREIVVYGNGIDCIKSYKAAEDAIYAMIPDVHAYDSGVAAWAAAYPSATMLLGRELSDPEKQLISAELFSRKNLELNAFMEKAAGKDAVVIDVRDPIQRSRKIPGLETALPISLDKFVENVVGQQRMKDKQLLILDQVGRQVNWLMYYLVDKDYTDFYFLHGGATGVLKEQEYRVSVVP